MLGLKQLRNRVQSTGIPLPSLSDAPEKDPLEFRNHHTSSFSINGRNPHVILLHRYRTVPNYDYSITPTTRYLLIAQEVGFCENHQG